MTEGIQKNLGLFSSGEAMHAGTKADSALEMIQEVASEVNKSKRQFFTIFRLT
jgi:hypothetical protein